MSRSPRGNKGAVSVFSRVSIVLAVALACFACTDEGPAREDDPLDQCVASPSWTPISGHRPSGQGAAVSGDAMFVRGDHSLIHYDGDTWRFIEAPWSDDLSRVDDSLARVADDEIYIVAATDPGPDEKGAGVVWSFDGESFSESLGHQPGNRLRALTQHQGQVWAVGFHTDDLACTGLCAGASVFAYRRDPGASAWVEDSVDFAGTTTDAVAVAPDELYLATSEGLLHRDAQGWTSVDEVPLAGSGLDSRLWATGPDDVWVYRVDGLSYHFDGATWAEVPMMAGADKLWGTGPDDVVATFVDGDGLTQLRHFDGNVLSNIAPATAEPASRLLGYQGAIAYVSEFGVGLIEAGDYQPWLSTAHVGDPRGMWGDSLGDMYVARWRSMLRLDVPEERWWLVAPAPFSATATWAGSAQAVDGPAKDDLWIVSAAPAEFLHWDGQTTTPAALEGEGEVVITDIYRAFDDTLWIVGSDEGEDAMGQPVSRPLVFRRDHGSEIWASVEPPAIEGRFEDVAGVGDLVLLTHETNRVFVSDESGWFELAGPAGDLLKILPLAEDDFLAVERTSTQRILRWQDGAWAPVPELPTADGVTLDGWAPNRVWVGIHNANTPSRFFRWDPPSEDNPDNPEGMWIEVDMPAAIADAPFAQLGVARDGVVVVTSRESYISCQ